jgi:hypothetical protein
MNQGMLVVLTRKPPMRTHSSRIMFMSSMAEPPLEESAATAMDRAPMLQLKTESTKTKVATCSSAAACVAVRSRARPTGRRRSSGASQAPPGLRPK